MEGMRKDRESVRLVSLEKDDAGEGSYMQISEEAATYWETRAGKGNLGEKRSGKQGRLRAMQVERRIG